MVVLRYIVKVVEALILLGMIQYDEPNAVVSTDLGSSWSEEMEMFPKSYTPQRIRLEKANIVSKRKKKKLSYHDSY